MRNKFPLKEEVILMNKKEPGPGDYDPSKVERPIKYSIGKRHELLVKDSPGPSSYQRNTCDNFYSAKKVGAKFD